MNRQIILEEFLFKKSQQKRRTSPCNYKQRYFVLSKDELAYFEHRPGKKPTLKGSIELSRIKCVEIVRSGCSIPCSFKYPFQVVHDNYCLYVFAPDKESRHRWVSALKEETKNNVLAHKYHPNFWVDGKWICCSQADKLATGCDEYDPTTPTPKPLPPTPELQRCFSDPGELVVVAVHDFSPAREQDLPLYRNEEYIVIDQSDPYWWIVQDTKGDQGYIPSSYVIVKSPEGIEHHEWYNKDITRTRAEQLLFKEDKEGAFMVRDSRHAGVYTVSVLTKALGSNGENNPRVKHYQIRETTTGETKYYLAEKYLFSSIPELIYYHQHNAAGLITRLRHPVSTRRERAPRPAGFPADILEIEPSEVSFVEEVGSGQFGVVQLGYWHSNDNLKVAIKMVREGAMSEEEFKEEAKVMAKMSHPKLVQLYGLVTQTAPMCLVFEFMEYGCLSDYLRNQRGSFSQDTLLGMCLDVCDGMAYLESANFIHRDLAARNCLVGENQVVKVSDFGMARFVLDDQYTSSYGSKFPVKWSAPEVIQYCKFSSKSDVWSFGVLMWEVYSEGKMPYENQSNGEVVASISSGLRLLKPRLASEDIYQLMEWSWKEKPEDRPSFAILFHQLAEIADF
ncbi:tyrosine-protein kinase ITK/TSK [Lepisosteus oculatus]|uniref:tyrosine-protein kinase ITK/TSK n=1 Tax=Lepisosteus oculatus TaxID=7918 RepID=UPI0035F52BC7